jgi:hypothetical protein
MTLTTQARELVHVLQAVVTALDRFDRPLQRDYTCEMADRLRPLVAELQSAVVSERNRPAAERVLADISELMHGVNGAATKGEMEIFADDTLDRYWRLSTIFQESRFSGQSL